MLKLSTYIRDKRSLAAPTMPLPQLRPRHAPKTLQAKLQAKLQREIDKIS